MLEIFEQFSLAGLIDHIERRRCRSVGAFRLISLGGSSANDEQCVMLPVT